MKNLYQDKDFFVMNERLIRFAGGRWYNPPTEEKILSIDVDEKMEELIKSKKKKHWGFKDSRSSLTRKNIFLI